MEQHAGRKGSAYTCNCCCQCFPVKHDFVKHIECCCQSQNLASSQAAAVVHVHQIQSSSSTKSGGCAAPCCNSSNSSMHKDKKEETAVKAYIARVQPANTSSAADTQNSQEVSLIRTENSDTCNDFTVVTSSRQLSGQSRVHSQVSKAVYSNMSTIMADTASSNLFQSGDSNMLNRLECRCGCASGCRCLNQSFSVNSQRYPNVVSRPVTSALTTNILKSASLSAAVVMGGSAPTCISSAEGDMEGASAWTDVFAGCDGNKQPESQDSNDDVVVIKREPEIETQSGM